MHSRPAARREVAGPTRARRAVIVENEIMVIATIGVVAVKVTVMIRETVIHETRPTEAVLSVVAVNAVTTSEPIANEAEATAAAIVPRDRTVLHPTATSITGASSIVRRAPREAITPEAAGRPDRPVVLASNADPTVHLPP